MDSLRGTFDSSDPVGEDQDWDAHDENAVRELPPEAIGQDERRMQVRAYNHWAGLLGDGTFPSIEDLEPHNQDDFGPNSVLLDFSAGIDDPAVQFLGDLIAEECGAEGNIGKLSDVPPRSLLSRITDHYMQILANQAPIGFEAEFVNQRGAAIMYRGILLPFSSDDETIDFIYGVINWKEIADQVTSDELLLEIDQTLELAEEDAVEDEDEPQKHHADPLMDAPSAEIFELGAENEADDVAGDVPTGFEPDFSDNVASLSDGLGVEAGEDFGDDYQSPTDDNDLPLPDFGHYTLEDPEEEDEEGYEDDAGYSFASLSDYIETPAKKAIDLEAEEFDPADYQAEYSDDDGTHGVLPVAYEPEFEDAAESPEAIDGAQNTELSDDAGLHDFLASARELAQTAVASEDRSRNALYAAVGRAYDFSLAAKSEPEEFSELLEENGMTVQERAPMTPVVKLVFGSDYDKTRLTEYAAVLSHAHRVQLERGALAEFLAGAEGGLKGVVAAERRLRKEEAGIEVQSADEVRKALAKKLRELEELSLDAISGEGAEFSLVMVRRDGTGGVSVIGEIDDVPMVERAAKKLVA